MSEAARRVREAAMDASSNDNLVDDEMGFGENDTLDSPLDKETLDERASTQMGEMWESRRRYSD